MVLWNWDCAQASTSSNADESREKTALLDNINSVISNYPAAVTNDSDFVSPRGASTSLRASPTFSDTAISVDSKVTRRSLCRLRKPAWQLG